MKESTSMVLKHGQRNAMEKHMTVIISLKLTQTVIYAKSKNFAAATSDCHRALQ